jgi:hypothetical protein
MRFAAEPQIKLEEARVIGSTQHEKKNDRPLDAWLERWLEAVGAIAISDLGR